MDYECTKYYTPFYTNTFYLEDYVVLITLPNYTSNILFSITLYGLCTIWELSTIEGEVRFRHKSLKDNCVLLWVYRIFRVLPEELIGLQSLVRCNYLKMEEV